MRLLNCTMAVILTASLCLADSGVILPGHDVHFGNIHVANLPGAGGNVVYLDNGTQLTLIVHDDAYCAVLKRNRRRPDRDVTALVLGGGYYAQANVSGSYIAVLGDNAAALSLALRPRHTNNGNTIDLLGNGNIAAAVRWCFGKGEILMNKIRFGINRIFPGSDNDAYICGDNQGTGDLAWANRSKDVAGRGNETIAWDGFRCATDEDDVDPEPTDVAKPVDDIRKDRTTDAVSVR